MLVRIAFIFFSVAILKCTFDGTNAFIRSYSIHVTGMICQSPLFLVRVVNRPDLISMSLSIISCHILNMDQNSSTFFKHHQQLHFRWLFRWLNSFGSGSRDIYGLMMVGFLVDASFIVLVLRPSLLLWAFWISQSFMYSTKTRQTASSKLIKAYGIIKVVNSEKILKFFSSLWILLLLLHMSLFHGTLICNFINKMNYREIQIRFLLSLITHQIFIRCQVDVLVPGSRTGQADTDTR